MFSIFSKTILNNILQEKEPNIHKSTSNHKIEQKVMKGKTEAQPSSSLGQAIHLRIAPTMNQPEIHMHGAGLPSNRRILQNCLMILHRYKMNQDKVARRPQE